MRIAFAGTPPFAVPSLRRLIDSRHEIVCVITQPDRPTGRGLKVTPPAVKKVAAEYGLKVFQPAKFNKPEFLDELDKLDLDLIMVAAYGRIFRERSLRLPRKGCVNLHASLLPKYRGVAPINWAIVRGENETGVTTFFMEKGVDTGQIILQKKTAIGENENAGQVHDRLAALGAEAVLETCDLIEQDAAPCIEQDETRVSYAPRLEREDARVTWDKPASDVHNHIRGFNPRPGAFTELRGDMVKIVDSRVGPVLDIEDESGMLISCKQGSLWLRELQAPGRKATDGASFSRGARLVRGEYFA